MNVKKLKTSQLLDEVEDAGKNDVLFEELLKELDERTPFAYIMERIEGLEKKGIELEKELGKLRSKLKAHAHLAGKVMVEV